ncbi:hypothetical protein CBR65_14685 [Cellvibrio sp. PSBB006]|nr:hypothetical protein CBR65_14685 [Cellvibrio sp. PSBB006]
MAVLPLKLKPAYFTGAPQARQGDISVGCGAIFIVINMASARVSAYNPRTFAGHSDKFARFCSASERVLLWLPVG